MTPTGELYRELGSYGVLGIVCIGLVWGLKTLWEQYKQVQEARIAERDKLVSALVESTNALREVAALLHQARPWRQP